MAAKIACIHCKALLDDWKAYAEHILAKHKNDKERCAWAVNALAVEVKQ